MSKTYFDLLLDLARYAIPHVFEGTATGGSTTTLEDSSQRQQADFYKNGTIFFKTGDNANICVKIDNQTYQKFTFATQSDACANGDTYAAAHSKFELWRLKQAINQALFGARIYAKDDTTTVDGGDIYTLPSDVFNVKRVEIQDVTTEPYKYQPHQNWEENAGLLIFKSNDIPDVTGNVIRLWYEKGHAALSALTDELDDQVNFRWLVYKAAVHLFAQLIQRSDQDHPPDIEMYNRAIKDARFEMRTENRGRFQATIPTDSRFSD